MQCSNDAIETALLDLTLFKHLRILFSNSDSETAQLLYNIAADEQKRGTGIVADEKFQANNLPVCYFTHMNNSHSNIYVVIRVHGDNSIYYHYSSYKHFIKSLQSP